MILYNVTVNVETSVAEDWLKWMRETHIPEVMATGHFTSYKMMRLISEAASPFPTYAIQYFAESKQELDTYLQNKAPELQAIHLQRYGEKCMAFRSILEEM